MCVVEIKARYAARDRVLDVILTERPSCRRGSVEVWSAHAGARPSDGERVAEHIVPADRCAREIVGFLKASCAARSRQLNGKPFGTRGNVIGIPFIDVDAVSRILERPLCQLRRAGARGAACSSKARGADCSLCRRGSNARGAACSSCRARSCAECDTERTPVVLVVIVC